MTVTLTVGVPATCTAGTITTTVFTAAGTITGTYAVGQTLTGTGVTGGTTISSFGTGSGGAGTYNVNISQTVVSTTITGGRQYSSWNAAVAAIPANISSSGTNTPYILSGYADSEFYTTTSSILVTIGGITTDTTNTITMTAAAGQSFMDNANAQTNALKYNAANGVGLRVNSGYSQVLYTSIANVIITRLQFSLNTTGGSSYCLQTDNNNYISNCIIESTGSNTPAVCLPGSFQTIVNTLIVAHSAGMRGISAGYDTCGLFNCTIVCPSDVGNTNYGIAANGETWTIHNTVIMGFGTNYYVGSATFSGLNNCSDQAIGFGSNNQASKTYANQFVGVTSSTYDYRLKSGADCIDHGYTDTSNVPGAAGTTNISGAVDIVNTSRPQGSAWDIGAWEFKSSTQSYSYTGTGGVAFSGSAALLKSALRTPVGGIVFAGSSAKLSGIVRTPSGGMVLGGTSAEIRSRVSVPTGGVILSGTSPSQGNHNTQSVTWTPSGGIHFAGVASIIKSAIRSASGGLLFAGSAPYSHHHVGTKIYNWIINARRRGKR